MPDCKPSASRRGQDLRYSMGGHFPQSVQASKPPASSLPPAKRGRLTFNPAA